ncbi:hydroxysqualene dehydroxylase HpnE [Streptacidiphilus jiangxiensis]|uniref:Squalene-associated FAD-dependent desaturase n=1 Tax=Streptacidiphilus jiangxiensis TaxID=235985 RepID=A0A1H8AQH6_STRJI|nr:hydroxysqualene dehydroxylase HpnE [Streptacidiphilus jiangxiensis]SEM72975.1 squalene-associated FAD-dependent desaturase [Streptacidiphilus jiangxiensis]
MSGTRQGRALVIGGGLAGITAALRLADAGMAVTLSEARPRLGGLAFSFQRGALTVDNGQHVFLRCCTAYRGLLQRLGVRDEVYVQPRLDVPVRDVNTGREGSISRDPLPVPLHLGRGLLRYPHLSMAERAATGRAALALKRLDLDDPALDRRSFGDWLRAHGQSARAVEALWDLVGVATLNATADESSLALAAMVFKTGLLTDPGASDIGFAKVPLGRIHDDMARAALDRAGVRVLLRARAVEIKPFETDGTGRHSVQLEGERLDGGAETLRDLDAVVLAVPQDAAHDLLPPGSLDEPEALLKLGYAPILNVHVVYDRPVLDGPFLAALGSPIQWVFDRTPHSGLQGPGQYLALSQSAAEAEIDLPVATLRQRYLPALERLLPRARGAEVTEFFVTRERTATFAPAPGNAALRPGPATRTPGVHLAGAWTATGWPATMESAVRSGTAAARNVLRELR